MLSFYILEFKLPHSNESKAPFNKAHAEINLEMSILRTDSGVPQVSVIGTLLFLLIINDRSDLLADDVIVFADDVKLFYPRANLESFKPSLSSYWT